MTTSLYEIGRSPSLLSRKSETSVTLTGRRPDDPWKITSSILPPRSNRADCSPSTQRTASETFDLPQPLGPTIAVTPCPKSSVTVSANDLKPDSSSLESFIGGPRGGTGSRAGPGGSRPSRPLRARGRDRAPHGWARPACRDGSPRPGAPAT